MYINDDYFFQPGFFRNAYPSSGWGMGEPDDLFNSFFQPYKPRPVAPQQKRNTQSGQQPKNNRRRRRTARKAVPPPEVQEAPHHVQEESALLIQTAFRAYIVKKQKLIENLACLATVSEKIDRALEKFHNITNSADAINLRGERLRMVYAELEENLTRGLLTLDGISVNGSELVRSRRKELVKFINTHLSLVDAKRSEIQASVAEEKAERAQRERCQQDESMWQEETDPQDAQMAEWWGQSILQHLAM